MNSTSRRTALRCAAAIVFATVLAGSSGASGGPAPRQAAQDRTRGRDLVFETADRETVLLPTVPRGYALVIGIGEYRNLDEARQLLFAQSDADAMYRVLISHEGGAFPPENVRLLTGARATLANIREALEEWLPSVAAPADRVVVYFAGHGFVQNGRGYLAPTDVDPRRLEETA